MLSKFGKSIPKLDDDSDDETVAEIPPEWAYDPLKQRFPMKEDPADKQEEANGAYFNSIQ